MLVGGKPPMRLLFLLLLLLLPLARIVEYTKHNIMNSARGNKRRERARRRHMDKQSETETEMRTKPERLADDIVARAVMTLYGTTQNLTIHYNTL